MYTSVLCVVCFVIFKSTNSKKYDNYTLFRAIPVNESQLIFLESLIDNYDVIFWKDIGDLYYPVDFVVHPDEQPDLLFDAAKVNLKLETRIPDVQKAFDQQTVKAYVRRRMNSMDWKNYYRLEDIYNWLQDLRDTHPGEVSLESIGKTFENRDIMSLKVLLNGSVPRSKVIVEGGIHSREWISSVFVTYLISAIVNARTSQEPDLKEIALSYEWYFVPVLNPDGYEFSHVADRMWRKNRNKIPVDLNRNFGAGFKPDNSTDKWSDSYPGPQAFSENESKAMAAFVKAQSFNLEYYLAFHSYGQYMILPYTYTEKHLDNYNEVYIKCSNAIKKIAERYNTRYKAGTAKETVGYITGGVSGCWVKKTFSVPYVITFELRDNGWEGFTLAPSKILPTCEETLDGVLSLLKLRESEPKAKTSDSAQQFKIFDQIAIILNLLFFIIVRSDY